MKTSIALAALTFAPLLSVGACHFYNEGGSSESPEEKAAYRVVKSLLPAHVQDVDILFVIDNSGSMREEQDSLAAWADESLFGVLGMPDGTPLDLQVAVVSTDLGAGPYGIQGCEGQGDGGLFLDGQAPLGCSAIDGGFLSDIGDLQGGRLTNFDGSLGEAFACLAELGTYGCGFEQPLQAMKRALDGSNAANAGFLREDALLAVVIVSDEDDCSVADSSLFDSDPSLDNTGSPLGSLSSFRCFDFGVQCEGDDPRTPGNKAECVAREDSAYLASIAGYAEFLQGVKSDASMVYVAGIFGNAGTVSVSLSPEGGQPQLDASCSSAGGDASPGVRLQQFLDAFPDRNQFASVCSDDMSGPLGSAAMGINATVGRSLCLSGAIDDVDSAKAGIQADCNATVIGASSGEELSIGKCTPGEAGPCYRLVEDIESCAGTATRLALDLSDAGDFAAGHKIELACRVP